MSDHFGILVYIRGLNFNHWSGYICWASISSKSNSVILICGLHKKLVFPMIQLPFFKDNKWFDSNKPHDFLLFSQPTTNQQLSTKRLFFQRLSDHRLPTHRLPLHQLTDRQPSTTDTPTHRPPITDPSTTDHRLFFFFSVQISFCKVFIFQYSKYQKDQWKIIFFLHLGFSYLYLQVGLVSTWCTIKSIVCA